MLSFIVEAILAVLLFRKKTPAALVAGITAIVLIVLVITLVMQAQYVQ